MNHSKLSWEMTANKKCLEEGKKTVDVDIPALYRGDVVDITDWGILDKDADAIPAGVRVSIDEGEGKIFKLTGPKTVYQVMDAILRTGRGDPMDYVYTEKDKELPWDCSKCPRQGFCGLQDLKKKDADGLPCYKALWSDEHCHNGLNRFGALITPDWFKMEHAVNNENGTAPPVEWDQCRQS